MRKAQRGKVLRQLLFVFHSENLFELFYPYISPFKMHRVLIVHRSRHRHILYSLAYTQRCQKA